MVILNAAARRAICGARPARARGNAADLLRRKGLSITRNIVSQRDSKADLCAGHFGGRRWNWEAMHERERFRVKRRRAQTAGDGRECNSPCRSIVKAK
jgi:hypothetical protein